MKMLEYIGAGLCCFEFSIFLKLVNACIIGVMLPKFF
jgi:hypothetical protein